MFVSDGRKLTLQPQQKMVRRASAEADPSSVRRLRTENFLAYACNVLGGNVLLVQLVLAFAGAMFVGSIMALVRPPAKRPKGASLKSAPKGRTIAMAAIGGFVSLWAIASLLSR